MFTACNRSTLPSEQGAVHRDRARPPGSPVLGADHDASASSDRIAELLQELALDGQGLPGAISPRAIASRSCSVTCSRSGTRVTSWIAMFPTCSGRID
jgi:hypothetical protein